jgi:hypothetical protein
MCGEGTPASCRSLKRLTSRRYVSGSLAVAAKVPFAADEIPRWREEYLRQGWVAIRDFVPHQLCAAMLAEV